jgi:ubiquinone/menaquinone biosynthesis C-methylase UbiE
MINNLNIKKIIFQVPPDYYFRLNFFQKLWHDRKWQVIEELIKKSQLKPKNILEIGCAAGHLTYSLKEIFPEVRVTGIDLYKPAIQYAQKKFPQIKFIVADAHKLPFKNRAFDLIICSETIEHVNNPQKVFEEIKRLLKDNGIAIIEMDSGNWLFKFIWHFWINFGKGRVWKHAHLHNLNASILERIIQKTKFKILEKKLSHLGMAVTFVIQIK